MLCETFGKILKAPSANIFGNGMSCCKLGGIFVEGIKGSHDYFFIEVRSGNEICRIANGLDRIQIQPLRTKLKQLLLKRLPQGRLLQDAT